MGGLASRFVALAVLVLGAFAALPAPAPAAVGAPGAQESRLIAFVASRNGNQDIYTMRDDGSGVRRLTTDVGDEFGPAWSPDGSRIAFWKVEKGGPFAIGHLFPKLYVMSVDGTDQTLVWAATRPMHDHAHHAPAWSPDGRRLVFESNEEQDEGISLYTIRLTDGRLRRLTHESNMLDVAPAWAPDGTRIYFARQDWTDRYREPTFQIFSVSPGGDQPEAITSDATYHWGPQPSPDGTRILFTRGDRDLSWTRTFVMNLDGTGMRRIGSGEFDGEASWAPDGKRIVLTKDPDGGTGARGCVFNGYVPECYYRIGPLPGDIYVMTASGAGARLLMRDAGSPSFAP